MSVTIIDIVKGGMQMAVLRYSKQRESIKNYLCGREDHPTADMIYTSIREEYPNISLGTIYRNLSLLVEIGEIQKERTGSMPGSHRTIILSAIDVDGSWI